ncbi:CCAAT/enhancer-binding protein zeta-like [Centruroides sculpturatus]|uniref:CCAAT/enhancer-binding protein zeta-like n=1 Tax=Centruroides sculpturatus TaxID=218467 RepID=UPI000C6D52DC|nr:CCAAT/enhancer-binding protein zeta-like [Centruroides sculpturatus]
MYLLYFIFQLLLCPEDSLLASRLIRIYFGFFKACTRTGEVENKMMSALLTGVNRAFPFVKDDKLVLIEQMDTLYQIVHLVSFNISIQALMLLFQVHGLDETLSDRFYVVLYKKLLDPGLSHSTRQTMFLNLIYRALKRDHIEQRVKAFVKRLFQVCEYQAPGLVCGTLILVSQLLKEHPNLLNSNNISIASSDDGEDDDSYEHYEDVSENEERTKESNFKSNSKQNSSWLHRNNLQVHGCTASKLYNPNHRNPLYAGAEYSIPWELTLLTKHFHPSVSVFSQQVLKGKCIEYDGDPLHDFTLIKFLDKFVYRNPKKSKLSPCENERQKIFGRQHQLKQQSLNINSSNSDNARPEEKFLYQYFQTNNFKQKDEKKDKDSDVESVASEDFEALLDKFEPGFKSDELNFAADISDQKQTKKRKKRKSESYSNDDDDDDDDEYDFNDDDEFNEAFKDFESDLENIQTTDINDIPVSKSNSKRRKLATKKVDSNKDEAFASAEQLSCILEDNQSNVEGLNMHSLINKDKSHEKQIRWEIKRDRWIRNVDWKAKKKGNLQCKRKLKSKIKKSNKKSKL